MGNHSRLVSRPPAPHLALTRSFTPTLPQIPCLSPSTIPILHPHTLKPPASISVATVARICSDLISKQGDAICIPFSVHSLQHHIFILQYHSCIARKLWFPMSGNPSVQHTHCLRPPAYDTPILRNISPQCADPASFPSLFFPGYYLKHPIPSPTTEGHRTWHPRVPRVPSIRARYVHMQFCAIPPVDDLFKGMLVSEARGPIFLCSSSLESLYRTLSPHLPNSHPLIIPNPCIHSGTSSEPLHPLQLSGLRECSS